MNEDETKDFQLEKAKKIVNKYVFYGSPLYTVLMQIVLDGMAEGINMAREILNNNKNEKRN